MTFAQLPAASLSGDKALCTWSVRGGVLNQQFSNVVGGLLGSLRLFRGFWEVTTIFKVTEFLPEVEIS